MNLERSQGNKKGKHSTSANGAHNDQLFLTCSQFFISKRSQVTCAEAADQYNLTRFQLI